MRQIVGPNLGVLALYLANLDAELAGRRLANLHAVFEEVNFAPDSSAFSLGRMPGFAQILLHVTSCFSFCSLPSVLTVQARTVSEKPVLYVDPSQVTKKADTASLWRWVIYLMRVLSNTAEALKGYVVLVNAEKLQAKKVLFSICP